jgi:glycosyltransferase involved in cell wall biosynthesis
LALDVRKDIPKLIFIGDGDQRNFINKIIMESKLENQVQLLGSIYDEDILASYISNAYMCLSPDQAGLSVLKVMGYGVPFVTSKNAITGGEIFNIQNNINGILFDDFSELKNIILDCAENPNKYIRMGIKAKEYYDNNRTIDKMVKGFVDAIEYVLKKL